MIGNIEIDERGNYHVRKFQRNREVAEEKKKIRHYQRIRRFRKNVPNLRRKIK